MPQLVENAEPPTLILLCVLHSTLWSSLLPVGFSQDDQKKKMNARFSFPIIIYLCPGSLSISLVLGRPCGTSSTSSFLP
jgi:hypothetical protein